MLDAAVDLTDDVNHLARVVVQPRVTAGLARLVAAAHERERQEHEVETLIYDDQPRLQTDRVAGRLLRSAARRRHTPGGSRRVPLWRLDLPVLRSPRPRLGP